MVTVTQAEVETWLERTFDAAELPRLNMLIDTAEALVDGASSAGTSEAVAKFVIFSVIDRALRNKNPEYKSETVGEVSYTRFDNAQTGVFLSADERDSLRGVGSSRARSVPLVGVGLREGVGL